MGLNGTERGNFWLSGPFHLTAINWKNEHHRMSVVASLVQGVKIVERDHQKKREGSQALASPWWEFFNFKMLCRLEDDSSIFGAIYEYKPPASHSNQSTDGCPRYVIAFRGTIIKPDTLIRDGKLDFRILLNALHSTSCFEIAMKAVRDMVDAVGSSNVWLAGHSLGSALALLAGKTMAKTRIFLASFLFNPPFPSAPIERIKNEKVKDGIRIAKSVLKAGVAHAMKKNNHNNQSGDTFLGLSEWVPHLFVNRRDDICAEYIGYFEQRKKMEEIGLGCIERSATQNSFVGLYRRAKGKESEPMHLIPSANLTVNSSPSQGLKHAHGIRQWWGPDLQLESKIYKYK